MPASMPAVFVHGVPDTHRVWSPLLARVARKDVVTLSLPGFGCPVPEGFDATKEAYVDWLLGELTRQSGPIDIVGHDWGALLVTRAVSLRPQAVRSWAVGAAPLDPDYEWHQAARAWQTPGMGERDPYAAARFGARLAERTGAAFVSLPGCSHWWQLERPDGVADELRRFW